MFDELPQLNLSCPFTVAFSLFRNIGYAKQVPPLLYAASGSNRRDAFVSGTTVSSGVGDGVDVADAVGIGVAAGVFTLSSGVVLAPEERIRYPIIANRIIAINSDIFWWLFSFSIFHSPSTPFIILIKKSIVITHQNQALKTKNYVERDARANHIVLGVSRSFAPIS